jgi:hypothetical protein
VSVWRSILLFVVAALAEIGGEEHYSRLRYSGEASELTSWLVALDGTCVAQDCRNCPQGRLGALA